MSNHQNANSKENWTFQLFLSEYQTVTTRIITYSSVSNGLVTIVITLFGFAFNSWFNDKPPSSIAFWGGLFILQLLEFLWMTLLHEIFSCANYIEKDLREKILRFSVTPSFWKYEHSRISKSRIILEGIIEVVLLLLNPCLIFFSKTILQNKVFHLEDYLGLIANVILMIVVLFYFSIIIKLASSLAKHFLK